MTNSYGIDTKITTLYPPAWPTLEAKTPLWMDLEEEEGIHPLLMIGKDLKFKDEIEDGAINNFISEPTSVNKHVYEIPNSTLGDAT